MGCVQNQNFPQWVVDMINAEFFTGKGNDTNYRSHFCVDCGGKSLRKIDVETRHKGHNVLQAFTCSREYGYNINDVHKISHLLDVSSVCPYKVNSGYVYFPKSRKKGDTKRNSSALRCVVCEANLSTIAKAGRHRFCSILCMLLFGGFESSKMMLLRNEVCLSERSGLENAEEGFQKPEVCSRILKIKIGVGITKADNASDAQKKHQQTKHQKKKRTFDEFATGQNNVTEKVQNKKEKLEKLVTTAIEDGKNTRKGLSFRKRSRKGKPCRAPFGVDESEY